MIKLKPLLLEGVKEKTTEHLLSSLIKGTKWEGKVFIAGGYVRDEVMGLDPKDIDLTVEAQDGGIEFATWLAKKLNIYKENSNPVIYPRFGTAKITLHGITYNGIDLSSMDIECVMTRTEKYTDGSRKPEVGYGTLKQDVDRRDFTVNSLLKDLSTGEILDLTGMGKDDIKKGIVRTPLNPDIIFNEDPLRMLRAIRFAVKYNWILPLFMIRALKKNASLLQNISSERIQDELNKMLLTDYPDKAIRLLQITGLSKYIFPELDKLINLKQNKYHIWDANKHTLMVLKNTPKDLRVRLAALFHDIGKADTKEVIDNEVHFYKHELISAEIARDIMTRLKYPNNIIDAVSTAVENHMRTKTYEDDIIVSDKVLRKLQKDLGDHLETTLSLIDADNKSHHPDYNLPNQITNLRTKLYNLKIPASKLKLPINGYDVMKLTGLKPGKELGDILKKLEDDLLENPEMTKEEAEKLVLQYYK